MNNRTPTHQETAPPNDLVEKHTHRNASAHARMQVLGRINRFRISPLAIAVGLVILLACGCATSRDPLTGARSQRGPTTGGACAYPRPGSGYRPSAVCTYRDAKQYPIEQVAAITLEHREMHILSIDNDIDSYRSANVGSPEHFSAQLPVLTFYAHPRTNLSIGERVTHASAVGIGVYRDRPIAFLAPADHSICIDIHSSQYHQARSSSYTWTASASIQVHTEAGYFYILCADIPFLSPHVGSATGKLYTQDDTRHVRLLPAHPVEAVFQQLVPPSGTRTRDDVKNDMIQALVAAFHDKAVLSPMQVKELDGIACRRFLGSGAYFDRMWELDGNPKDPVLYVLCTEEGVPGYYPSDPESELPTGVAEHYILNLLHKGYRPSAKT